MAFHTKAGHCVSKWRTEKAETVHVHVEQLCLLVVWSCFVTDVGHDCEYIFLL